MWNTNKIKILNRDSLVLLSKKIFNFFERLGHLRYVRAVNRLIRQGLYEEAEVLVLDLKLNIFFDNKTKLSLFKIFILFIFNILF